MSSRELVSSGSDDWLGVSIALLSFGATVLVGALSRRPEVVSWSYIGNWFFYAFYLALVQLDTSLVSSVKFGDWLLALGLAVPLLGLILAIVEIEKSLRAERVD